MFDVDNSKRSNTAALGVPVCSARHHWSPPLLIVPPVALAPLFFSDFFHFQESFMYFPHLLTVLSQWLCVGSEFQ